MDPGGSGGLDFDETDAGAREADAATHLAGQARALQVGAHSFRRIGAGDSPATWDRP